MIVCCTSTARALPLPFEYFNLANTRPFLSPSMQDSLPASRIKDLGTCNPLWLEFRATVLVPCAKLFYDISPSCSGRGGFFGDCLLAKVSRIIPLFKEISCGLFYNKDKIIFSKEYIIVQLKSISNNIFSVSMNEILIIKKKRKINSNRFYILRSS